MKRKVMYVLLLGGTFVAAIFTEEMFFRFLFVFEVFYAVLMAVWVRLVASALTVSVDLGTDCVERKGELALVVQAKSGHRFPVSKVRFEVVIRDLTKGRCDGGGTKRIKGETGCRGKKMSLWKMRIRPVHCGLLGISLKEARMFDYLGLFSAKVKIKKQERLLTVIPAYRQWENEEKKGAEQGEEHFENAVERAGRDSQEIFDIRTYQRGDALRAVHWKLSAKEEELLVREYSRTAKSSILVAADCGCEKPEEVTMKDMDVFLEACASVCGYLTEKNVPFKVIWEDPEKGKRTIGSRERQRQELLEELLGIVPFKGRMVLKNQETDVLYVTWDRIKEIQEGCV